MLMCNKAYYGDAGRIYCTNDGELCAHQRYCDMSMKYKLTTTECAGKEIHDKKRNEADKI